MQSKQGPLRSRSSEPGCRTTPVGLNSIRRAAGAVADLYDISCLGGTSKFGTVQDEAYGLLKDGKASCISSKLHLDPSGKHFFTPTASGTAPVWDMRAVGPKGVQGKTGAYVLAAKVANLPAPSGTGDVDWLQLKNVEGLLAKDIYRTETRGGQPHRIFLSARLDLDLSLSSTLPSIVSLRPTMRE